MYQVAFVTILSKRRHWKSKDWDTMMQGSMNVLTLPLSMTPQQSFTRGTNCSLSSHLRMGNLIQFKAMNHQHNRSHSTDIRMHQEPFVWRQMSHWRLWRRVVALSGCTVPLPVTLHPQSLGSLMDDPSWNDRTRMLLIWTRPTCTLRILHRMMLPSTPVLLGIPMDLIVLPIHSWSQVSIPLPESLP